ERGGSMADQCAYLSAGLFAVLGGCLLYTGSVEDRVLLQPEAVSGFKANAMLITAGLGHLVLAAVLAVAQDQVTRASLMLWAGLNYALYRMATKWLATGASVSLVEVVGRQIGVSPAVVDLIWRVFIWYLVAGGVVQLGMQWRRSSRRKREAFVEKY